jgi:uncharacterized protein YnzC (UPF0291/DUF896 family)
MLHDDLLKRINELANKAKEEELTEDEKREQKRLRKAYLKAFRSSFKKEIEGMKIVDPEGQDVTPGKLKKIQKEKRIHNRHLGTNEKENE